METQDITEIKYDTNKQDSAFYTNSAGSEVVWEHDDKRFYVVRNGEMRIHATDSHGDRVVIRYTDQLEDFGIKNDADLARWSKSDPELFDWVNNSWFEVYDESDPDFFSDPIHELGEAVNYALELVETYGKDKVVE
jgi:CRP-like cAMP-binding protein